MLTKHRTPQGLAEGGEIAADQPSREESISYCMKDLILAIHAHDPEKAAKAVVDAFDILENQPHDEY